MASQPDLVPVDLHGLTEAIRADEHVSLEELPEQDIRIIIRPSGADARKIALCTFIVGIVAAAAGWFGRGFLGELPFTRAPYILMFLGLGLVGISLVIVLTHAVAEPPRPSILEAWPGRFKADRIAGGDRMQSDYGPDDVHCLFVDAHMLYIAARKGELPLATFGKRSTNIAIACLIAQRLWANQVLAQKNMQISGVARWLIGPLGPMPEEAFA